MTTVTVSPKFPVVIPQKIRESLNIHPGQKVQILSVKGTSRSFCSTRLERCGGFSRESAPRFPGSRAECEFECRGFVRMARIFRRWTQCRFFAPPFETPDLFSLPSISLLEVFKRILRQRGENEALQALALMMEGRVVDLDADPVIRAKTIGRSEKLPLADCVMLATALKFDALLWSQDGDFENLSGIRFIKEIF